MTMNPDFKIINLDVDHSIAAQPELQSRLQEIITLTEHQDNLRLWANEEGLSALRNKLRQFRQEHPEPWLTFVGSGDLHHLTLALLESLPHPAPFTLVLIDNHPDWFCEKPVFHCGNWLSGALRLPGLQSARLVAQDSEDLKGHHFWTAPWPELCSGRLKIYPYRRQRSLVPLRWSAPVKGVQAWKQTLAGTEFTYQTVDSLGETAFFDMLAHALQGQRIYLSIDKDCLREEDALTDWEQGCLSLSGLVHGIRRLRESCEIIGADVCGERAPTPLKGLVKRLDAGRLQEQTIPADQVNRLNEQTNLAILNAFMPKLAVTNENLCPA